MNKREITTVCIYIKLKKKKKKVINEFNKLRKIKLLNLKKRKGRCCSLRFENKNTIVINSCHFGRVPFFIDLHVPVIYIMNFDCNHVIYKYVKRLVLKTDLNKNQNISLCLQRLQIISSLYSFFASKSQMKLKQTEILAHYTLKRII